MQTPRCALATPVHAQPSHHQQHQQPYQQGQVGGTSMGPGAPQSSMKLVGIGAADAYAPTPAPPPHPSCKPIPPAVAGGGSEGEARKGWLGVAKVEEGEEELSYEEQRAVLWQRRHGSLLPHVQQLQQQQRESLLEEQNQREQEALAVKQQQQQQQAREQALKEQQAREQALEEQQAKDQAHKEQQAKEKALKEQQAREEALKEQHAKEQALREVHAKEQALREQQAREQVLKEQHAREHALKEQHAREQVLKEQHAKEQALREQHAKEQALREQQAKDQALREQQAREQQQRQQQQMQQMHEPGTWGLGSGHTGSAQGSSTACAEPTVTINTRAAFDAMNDIFGDEAGSRVQAEIREACKEGGGGQALVQAALSALPASALARTPSLSATLGLQHQAGHAGFAGGSGATNTAAAGSGGIADVGGPISRRCSAPDSSGNAPKRAALEPTVTINTRAAFDAMNDMFGDGGGGGGAAVYNLQQQDDTMARLPSLTLPSKPISAMDVCRLANSRTSAARSAGGRPSLLPPQQQQQPPPPPHLRDDTTTTDLWGARSTAEGQEDALRPDTEFLTRGLSASLAGGSRPGQRGNSRRSSIGLPGLSTAGVSTLYGGLSAGGVGGGGGMGMYEDTVCMSLGPMPVAVAPAAGGLRERQLPQRLTDGASCQAPPHQQHQQQVAPPAMGLYEDTEFFSGGDLGVGPPAPVPNHRAPLASQPQQPPPHQLPLGPSCVSAVSTANAGAQLSGKEAGGKGLQAHAVPFSEPKLQQQQQQQQQQEVPAKVLQQCSVHAAGVGHGDKENAVQP
ncbi:hypothetical protein DUNSADRAFT_5631 [Dunaliella salina]|uniref:Uncharacterized protein n=1 Tax=Dunaliella salina TaxID=3046 RepID=A0ABQ7GPU8_DUNSA|nr:hypothetical protein DUNSADRAFT_5631 [Dunaliella salina]|eukprot:KAF5836637.1 hypothetical protein DUNSADRAFT_5631 [Dunaliella salina]